eukprot:UN02167
MKLKKQKKVVRKVAPVAVPQRTHLTKAKMEEIKALAPKGPAYVPPTAEGAAAMGKGKLDINAVEDAFRANRLAGLGEKFHRLNRAFDVVRAGSPLTPEQEADLKRVWDVTSLQTADSAEMRKAKTKALIEHYQRRPGDTGSPEVQVVLMTERINYLNFHMTRHRQDRRLKLDYERLVVRRRKTLKYLKRHRFRTYQIICRDLGVNEEELDIVGRLPHTAPYYDPTRPIYRRPLDDIEMAEQEQIVAAERKKQTLQQLHKHVEITRLFLKNAVAKRIN